MLSPSNSKTPTNMESQPAVNLPAAPAPAPARAAVKIFGVGNAGIAVMERVFAAGMAPSLLVAVNPDLAPLASSSAGEKVQLETRPPGGLPGGGDPERARAMAEEHAAQLQALCAGADAIFIIAGLGGGAGTGISPVLARIGKENGALVLAFVTIPFPCEGSRRRQLAEQGIEQLKAAADGVICLPNEKISALTSETTTVVEAFQLADQLLADGVQGIWRLLTHKGLIDLHFDDLCGLVRDRHAESAFAVVEAAGATRSREVLDKLLSHPMLENGDILARSGAVLVSLLGGPDLTLTEVNRVMEAITARCGQAQVSMGAAIDEAFRERLALTVLAATQSDEPASFEPAVPGGSREDLDSQLLNRASGPRPSSRFIPPPPALPAEQVQEMLARQRGTASRQRKTGPKLRQTQLPLEIVSKGRFDKSEPTIHKGEDLDVPTYIRRGVSLN